MDTFNAVGEQMRIPPCLCASYTLCFLLSIVTLITAFTFYLGKYALDNPNPDCWYAGDGKLYGDDSVTLPDLEASYDITPVHYRFVRWFFWGFINQLVLISLPFLRCLLGFCNTIGDYTMNFTYIAFLLSSLVWWIMGMIYRFSASGRYASGDASAIDLTEIYDE